MLFLSCELNLDTMRKLFEFSFLFILCSFSRSIKPIKNYCRPESFWTHFIRKILKFVIRFFSTLPKTLCCVFRTRSKVAHKRLKLWIPRYFCMLFRFRRSKGQVKNLLCTAISRLSHGPSLKNNSYSFVTGKGWFLSLYINIYLVFLTNWLTFEIYLIWF